MVAAVKITQSAANDVYQFVPKLDMKKEWSDEELFKEFEINDSDKKYINRIIAKWEDVDD